MIETIRNAWRIDDLRKKILFTFLIVILFRIGAYIPVPFINTALLQEVFATLDDTLFGYMNMLSGGAFSNATLFAMSITPYINASIIIQLLTVAIPALERMVKEGGEGGRKKQAAITRYATVGLGLFQGLMYYITLNNQGMITDSGIWAGVVITLSFTSGTALIMWLGEQITEHGIGNGISIILFAGIVSRVPDTLYSGYQNVVNGSMPIWGVFVVLLLALVVVAFVVFMQNAERRIPVQYAKRVVGRKMYGGQSTYIPLKVNMTGVLPIIFASSIVSLPSTISAFIPGASTHSFWGPVLSFIGPKSWFYAVIYLLLIIAFSFFYAAIQFNPMEMANNLKKNGGFVLGLRAGRPTAEFLTKVMNKITFIGSIFLGAIATLPIVMSSALNLGSFALGGTSMLIVVGVALETVRQMESMMMMRHYKGFLE